MSNSPNCAWAHHVGGLRFEAVPLDGDKSRWRLFNRTQGVLLDSALGFAEAESRGELLLKLDRAAAAMGHDAFAEAVAGGGMVRKLVTLVRTGSDSQQELGATEIALPAQATLHDVLQFALYEFIKGRDAGPDVRVQIDEPVAADAA